MLVLFLFFITTSVYSLDWESGTQKANLVELFTSESCSSCPPAEKWMNNLKNKKFLFKKVVPVEFHIDYWNHLSWKDKFSTPQFSNRQRRYASLRNKRSVFTPQLLVNGTQDIRYSNPYPKKTKGSAPNLKIKFMKEKSISQIDIEGLVAKGAYCEGAILGGDYSTQVKSGENSGKVLEHQFVVLELKQSQIKDSKCNLSFKKLKDFKNKSIAIWIKKKSGLEVIQATGHQLE